MTFKTVLSLALVALILGSNSRASTVDQATVQKRPASYEDVRAHQALGRVVVSSDGQFMLYEWGHPYLNWVPDVSWMAPVASRRMEVFLYKVDLRADTPTSEYLFYPNAGASYWLGELSPNNRYVAVYELNHDNRSVRAGVWNFEAQKMQWFSLPPDEGRLQELSAWVSNDELVYPAKRGAATNFVRASMVTGVALPCGDCTAASVQQVQEEASKASALVRDVAAKIQAKDALSGAVLRTGAANGSVAIYIRDNADVLSMLLKRPSEPLQILFENSRRDVP